MALMLMRITGAVKLKIARRVTAGWLQEENIQEFPCPDLQTIDHLWIKYSQERFGFTVQNRIWENVGEDYGRFGDSVGWRLFMLGVRRRRTSMIFSAFAVVGR